MRLILKKNGFTVLEAVVAIAIISFVLVSTITLLINVQNQNRALNEQINATSYATMIRDDIQYDVTITSISSQLGNNLNYLNHPTIISYVFDPLLNPYYNQTPIVFIEDSNAPSWLSVVRFSIQIVYYKDRSLVIEGVLYE